MSVSDGIIRFDPSDVYEYAKNDSSRWKHLEGAKVLHQRYGDGQIVSVDQRINEVPLITVKFSGVEPKKFPANGLGPNGKYGFTKNHRIITEVQANQEARRKSEQKKMRLEEERIFAEDQRACAAEGARRHKELELAQADLERRKSETNRILQRIENNQFPLKADDSIILEYGMQWEVAEACEERFNSTGRSGWAAIASKWWRKGKLPKKAIRIADRVRVPDNAVLTTKAAAFADLGKWSRARRTIESAREIKIDKLNQNTLLRIMAGQGDYQEISGEIEISEKLIDGSRPLKIVRSKTDSYLKEGFEYPAESEEQREGRRRMVARLLEIDADRFAWAKRFAD